MNLTRHLILLSILVGAAAQAATLSSSIWVDGVKDGSMQAGAQSQIEFEYHDADTGAMAHHFHIMHAKPMHLIAVSEDLSHFVHVHPDMKEHSMKPFVITTNSESADPDNFALPDMIPFGGHFMLFGEVMPMGYGMLSFPYDLNVTGPTRAEQIPDVDKPDSDGKIFKYFSDDDSIVASSEAKYLLKLELIPMDHCNTIIPRLHFEILQRVGGDFEQVKDLDQWLESYGHAIMIGREGKLAAEKAILHLHAVWPLPTGDPAKDERGPFVELTTHSHGKSMQSDRYHAWIQVKHLGKVHTFNFELNWNLATARLRAFHSPEFCIN